jgi:hypothetical protein
MRYKEIYDMRENQGHGQAYGHGGFTRSFGVFGAAWCLADLRSLSMIYRTNDSRVPG